MCWILLDLTLCPRVLRESHKELRRAACTRGRTSTDTHWIRLNTPMKKRGNGGLSLLLKPRSVTKAGRMERREGTGGGVRKGGIGKCRGRVDQGVWDVE